MFRLPPNPGHPWIPGGAPTTAAASGPPAATHTATQPRLAPTARRLSASTYEVQFLKELQQLAQPETVHILRQRITQRLTELGVTPRGPQSLLQLFETIASWTTPQTQAQPHNTVSPSSEISAISESHSIISPVTTNGSAGSVPSAPSIVPSAESGVSGERPSMVTQVTSKMSRQLKGKTPTISSVPTKGYYANCDTAPGLTLARMLCASPEYELRESFFQKCFPLHRKQFEHATQPRAFLRSPRFKKVLISPDCTIIALVADRHWEVLRVPENFNFQPILLCEGLMNGSYGRLTEARYPKKDRYTKEEETQKGAPPGPPDLGDFEWEFCHASLSNRYLAITGTKGMVRVFDIEALGRPVYTYRSDFNAQAIALSPSGSLLVCSITGRDLKTDAVKPMIALHNLGEMRRGSRAAKGGGTGGKRRDSFATSTISRTSTAHTAASTHSNDSSTSSTFGFSRGSPTTLTTPYTDPVTRLIISAQETSILCATESQSRFFVIDVQSPVEPRLIMKSARRADASPEAEGITDLAFFPNQQVVVVASLAKDSPPIVVDTNVRNLHPALPPTSVSQPALLARLDALGHAIHCVAVSPRGDSMAFVDKSGLVYVVFLDPHTYAARKTVLVTEVASANNAYEAAAIRYSGDGQVLFTVDHKGVLHIQDWGAGLPNHAGIGKCQTLRSNKS